MLHQTGLSLEEKTHSLWELDQLLPIQFFEAHRRKAHLEPERLLMLAVLEDAFSCLQNHPTYASRKHKKLFDETLRWVLTDDDDWLFSFNNVCEAVGLSPGWLRRGLTRIAEGGSGSPGTRGSARSPESTKRGTKGRMNRAAA